MTAKRRERAGALSGRRIRMDRGGMSMVELLVAMVILTVISLALMRVALLNIEVNTRNALRDEGTRLVTSVSTELRSVPMSSLGAVNGTSGTVILNVRNIRAAYTVTNTVTSEFGGFRECTVTVAWQFKGVPYNTAATVLRGGTD